MLQLKKITKEYPIGNDSKLKALKGISLNFRKSEFVSILGPSGCGKTTLLNIIGGLDHYTSGNLVINNKSTKDFKDKDWDNYRNKKVGFVFQSYNLIPNINLLNNVAMGLTLAGVKKSERIKLAKEALEKVGLGKQIKKKPNQLSGGQMQRVAIARAIVGKPDIILADEPTGALDSETGIQIMEILKEISKEKLVIMVTHNPEIANEYSTRIIKMFDGNLMEDSNPYGEDELEEDSKRLESEQKQIELKNSDSKKKEKKEKVSMSIGTAYSLSGKTLLSRKGRTIITSIAGSVGIFAITLILAISNGMNGYVNNIQSSALGTSAITISETTRNISVGGRLNNETDNGLVEYPSNTSGIYPYTDSSNQVEIIYNNLSDEFLEYLDAMDESYTSTIEYSYSTKMNIIANTNSGYKLLTTNTNSSSGILGSRTASSWYDVSSQTLSNQSLITNSYDVLYKTTETGIPTNHTELALVVDKYNRIKTSTLDALGIDYSAGLDTISYADLVGKEFKLVLNNDFYSFADGVYKAPTTTTEYENLYKNSNAITLKIVGVLRLKNDDATEWLSEGIVYSSALTDFVRNDAINSDIGKSQIDNKTTNILTGETFTNTPTSKVEDQYKNALKTLGVYSSPTSISIYPAGIDEKDKIVAYLDEWNNLNPDNKIIYTDFSELLLGMLSSLIDTISYVLIAFCAVSLVVSTVMISVTTYTSVIERTKEIGVLRSLGARKKDISRIFNAETSMIGVFAGIIGVGFAYIVGIIANAILKNLLGTAIVSLTLPVAIIMIALSTGLTLLAGLIPAKIAAKKDPVLCLRTE